MALSQSALSELHEVFRSGKGTDVIRECVRVAMQKLIDAEATATIGAARYERTQARVTERNGSRPRLLTAHAGDIHLAVPKLRAGSFFPIGSAIMRTATAADGMLAPPPSPTPATGPSLTARPVP